jgi:uncharacterized protein (DUF885 family)
MGLYPSDFNRLSMYAGVPNAMVVDPGVHALGWTRQQAIDYILAKSPGSTPWPQPLSHRAAPPA